jgi:hypothetical protein
MPSALIPSIVGSRSVARTFAMAWRAAGPALPGLVAEVDADQLDAASRGRREGACVHRVPHGGGDSGRGAHDKSNREVLAELSCASRVFLSQGGPAEGKIR